ncbi:hypothetical protein MHLP_02070 [Candidatus Mycoplasma haematolamae str. Purdue]|uniref:Uncharacterized protein n=1 Tax=Mycoplasma haematolamae (strain Purdue) TaxID=1212765 RepID=I7CJH2_MYCHA|nr:hypothetical protein [Candidatus Mycoplasma haematolamae]AFO51994.1 hypothetical protein MHLP_02070 [Candidatus Mycoplasma haematolamae str. Purdue]
MALPVKAIVLSCVGAGAVTGGVGTTSYVLLRKPSLTRSLEKESSASQKDSPVPGVLGSTPADTSEADSRQEASALTDPFFTQTHVKWLVDISKPENIEVADEEDEEDDDKEDLKVRLVLTKGDEDQGLGDSYILKMYLDKNAPTELGNAFIDFSVRQDRMTLTRYVERFNNEISFSSTTLAGFLEELMSNETQFKKHFSKEGYDLLKSKAQDLVNKSKI